MKYPSIPRLDEMAESDVERLFGTGVQIFEKMDGVNTQISVNGDVRHGLRSGSVSKRSRGEFPWVEDFNRFFWSNMDRFSQLKPNIYFGEFMTPMRVRYNDDVVNAFILIDVFDPEKGLFLPYEQGLDLTESVRDLMLPAEKLYDGSFDSRTVTELIRQPSHYAMDGIKEGVVIKNYNSQAFAKAFHPRYDEKLAGDKR